MVVLDTMDSNGPAKKEHTSCRNPRLSSIGEGFCSAPWPPWRSGRWGSLPLFPEAAGSALAPTVEERSRQFLKEYVDGWLPLETAASEANWAASTDVSEAHTAAQVARNLELNRYVGSPRGHRHGPRPAEPQGRAPRLTGPPAREGPPPRRRGAGHDPRGRQGPHRGRGQAVGHPGRRSPSRSAAETRTHPPRPTTSTGPGRVARPGRAPRGLGGIQDDRPAAPRRPAAAPRPPEQGRPGDGLRRLLRAPGRRLRHDRPGDDGALRPPGRRDRSRSTSSSTPGPGTPWRSAIRPRPRATARSPPTGSPTAGARTGPGWSKASTWTPRSRASPGSSSPSRPSVSISRSGSPGCRSRSGRSPTSTRPTRNPAARRTATPAPGTSTCARTSAA